VARGGECGAPRGGGPECTASGVPRESYGSWDRAFPPISAPGAPPRAPLVPPSGITPSTEFRQRDLQREPGWRWGGPGARAGGGAGRGAGAAPPCARPRACRPRWRRAATRCCSGWRGARCVPPPPPSGARGRALRPALGGEGAAMNGIHCVRGASGDVLARGSGLSPDLGPLAPPVHPPETLDGGATGQGPASGRGPPPRGFSREPSRRSGFASRPLRFRHPALTAAAARRRGSGRRCG